MDMMLMKNGSIKHIPKKKNKIKKNAIKCILLECENPIIGKFYYTIDYKHYRKLSRLKSIIFKYKFLDGYDIYNDTDLYSPVTYEFKKPNDFISKTTEMAISEYVFNDVFWLDSSFPCYQYTELKVRYKDSKLKKKKTVSYASFNDNYIDNDNKRIFKHDFMDFGGKFMCQILNNTFIEVKPSILDCKKVKVYQKIYLNEYYYDEYNAIATHKYKFDLRKRKDILNLFILIASKEIIERLETDAIHDNLYEVKLGLLSKKKRKHKENKRKFKKFIHKYFKGV